MFEAWRPLHSSRLALFGFKIATRSSVKIYGRDAGRRGTFFADKDDVVVLGWSAKAGAAVANRSWTH